MVANGNSVFADCVNFMLHFQVVIFARKLSNIIGNIGNVGASKETFSKATTNFLFISTNYIAENDFHNRIWNDKILGHHSKKQHVVPILGT